MKGDADMTTNSTVTPGSVLTATRVTGTADQVRVDARVVAELIARASSPGYEAWWAKVTGSGFCASPVHLHRTTNPADGARVVEVFARCKNRRAAVCPSCSALYAGDTWQLVHAGIGGGHGVPATVAAHPAVFATLTAPGFGAVHRAVRRGETGPARRCHSPRPGMQVARCRHGRLTSCTVVHDVTGNVGDQELSVVGQPLYGDCYDYTSQVLFTWHAPALWQRFTIALRRAVAAHLRAIGDDPASVRVSFVKVVELQRRGVPHFHAVIRLDDATTGAGKPPTPPAGGVIAAEVLAGLTVTAALRAHLDVAGHGGQLVTLRFGAQLDVQTLTHHSNGAPSNGAPSNDGLNAVAADPQASNVGRRVAGYLAKYVTKSVAEFGIAARRISPHLIGALIVSDHVRRILDAITALSREPGRADMAGWLHTLGYRGHVTTKSRRYSVTMGLLSAHRAVWRSQQNRRFNSATGTATMSTATPAPPAQNDVHDPGGLDGLGWEFTGYGHASTADRLLALSAAARARDALWAARDATAIDPGYRDAP
jgi:hypothetical protein